MGERNRATAKKNGTAMETAVQDYLAWALNDMRIMRTRTHGSKDIGDIGNVFFHGEPVTIEVKWTKTMNAPEHMREAVKEAGNADSPTRGWCRRRTASDWQASTSWANSTPTRPHPCLKTCWANVRPHCRQESTRNRWAGGNSFDSSPYRSSR